MCVVLRILQPGAGGTQQQPRTLAYGGLGLDSGRGRLERTTRRSSEDSFELPSKRASISVVLWALNGGRLERDTGIQDTAGLRTRHETGDETEGNSRGITFRLED